MEVIVRKALESRLRIWLNDPVAFCHDAFPKPEWPRPQQEEILYAIRDNPQSVVAAYRFFGKSRTAAFAVHWFNTTHANSLTVTLAPIWGQATQGVWIDIRHLWAVSKLPLIFPKWRCLTQELLTHPSTPKWRVIARAASEVQNVEGAHGAAGRPTLLLLDESKAIPDIFRESIEGMLVNPDSRLFAIGTPGIPFGWFYEAFTKNRREYWCRQFRGDESPDPNVRAKVKKIGDRVGWDDPYFRQQWLAEFTGADEGAIIPLSIVSPAVGRKFERGQAWRKTMSIDPAGAGSDHSVVTYSEGPVTVKQVAWQGWDIVKSERHSIRMILDWKPDVVVIDGGGLGEGVVSHVRDELKGTDTQIIDYRGGHAARDNERFQNRKAEDVYALRERYKEGAEDVARIKSELTARVDALALPNGVTGEAINYLQLLTYGRANQHVIATARPESNAAAMMTEEAAREMKRGKGRSIPNEPSLIGQTCSWVVGVSKTNRTMVVDPNDSPDYADSDLMGSAVGRMGRSIKGSNIGAF